MKTWIQLLPVHATLLMSWHHFALAQEAVIPKYKSIQTLVKSSDTPATPYLAFPTLLDLGNELLVSFKRGHSHMGDPGAALDLVRLNRATGQVMSRSTLAQIDDKIMQNSEWVHFANGDIANYIDVQQKGTPLRLGLRVVRSSDSGHTFSSVERVGAIDGVEYGYAFEAITRDKTTWMLVIPSKRGSVDVIRTDDNGKTWRIVRSITKELDGAAINESSFIAYGTGFIVAARGYDQHQWLLLTDGDFKVKLKVDLPSVYSFIKSYIGRPRLFARDGGYYLLARNFTGPNAAGNANPKEKGPMRLSLFKFDPETLAITKHVLLDNAEGENVADGYYAVPYWQERGGQTCFNVITYKRPNIIRLEFDWGEVR